MAGVPSGPAGFMLISIAALIVLGSVLEGIPAIVLFGPLLFPVARQMGINEVHYAMVVILAMGPGLFAPPFGLCYYAACIIGDVPPKAGLGADLDVPIRAPARTGRHRIRIVDFDGISLSMSVRPPSCFQRHRAAVRCRGDGRLRRRSNPCRPTAFDRFTQEDDMAETTDTTVGGSAPNPKTGSTDAARGLGGHSKDASHEQGAPAEVAKPTAPKE